ncbi:MAG TPA: Imm50 family immunity protein [Terracidiphilus sp.]|nr:Imm50 family immunity protein [Terracidiphilus sp.]
MILSKKASMEKFDPSPHIKNSYKITDVFGFWPSFQDAEILDLRLSVADGEPWVAGSESPALEMTIHVFERTDDLTPEGRFVLNKHTLVRLRFRNIDGLQLSNFWYQNCIADFDFGIEPPRTPRRGGASEDPQPNLLLVSIQSSVGLSGKFKCQSAEVISTEPCDEKGKPIRSGR